MSSKFDDRFTERARRVLMLAQEEAKRLNDSYIGTEHLLLGLVQEERGVAARVLRDMGVKPVAGAPPDRGRLRAARANEVRGQATGLTPRTKRVIERAVDEARRMNHHYIGTEHLLLGLIGEGGGLAVDVLQDMGVDLDAVRMQTTAPSCRRRRARAQNARSQPADAAHGPAGRRPHVQAEEGKLDPVVGRQTEIERVDPDPVAPHQEQPGAHRRAGRRQDGHRRRPGPAHRRRRGAGAAARQAGVHARRGQPGRRHDLPRPVRRAHEARHRRDQGHRRHPLHRRAAHAGRRRLGRLERRRRQPAQAGPGARRAAVHRRDDAGRVPALHRVRCGSRAPLPTGVRRGAVRGGDGADPAGHPAAATRSTTT